MEDTEVEVVSDKPNYTEMVKEAAIRGAVTAVASIAATFAISYLAAKVNERRKNKTNVNQDTTQK